MKFLHSHVQRVKRIHAQFLGLKTFHKHIIAWSGLVVLVLCFVFIYSASAQQSCSGTPQAFCTPENTQGHCTWSGGTCVDVGGGGGGGGTGGSGGGAPRDQIYGAIGNTLSGQGIKNNFSQVTTGNAQNFTGLYFAKMSGDNELGRITFSTGLDLTDTGTQNFLSGELPSSIGMEEGQVRFRPGLGFEGKAASLEIKMPKFREPYLSGMDANDFYVREGSGGALTGNNMINGVTPGGPCMTGQFGCSINLNVGHFTMFGVKPILTYVHIRSDAGTGTVGSGTTIYLAFTGSEPLDSITVGIAGNPASLVGGGGTNRVYSLVLTTGGVEGTDVPFAIHFSDYFGNGGNEVTGSTDASYVRYHQASTGPNREEIYGQIGANLIASGIKNNFSGVNNTNADSYSGLFFAKMSGETELGRITFPQGMDLTNSGTQQMLQNLGHPGLLDMAGGYIKFSPGLQTALNTGAQLSMNFDTGSTFISMVNNPNFFEVENMSGDLVNPSDVLSNVHGACGVGEPYCTIVFDTQHFTEFRLKPFLTSVHVESSNTNTGIAYPGDTVYLTFQSNDAITGVVIYIGGNNIPPIGGGTSWTGMYVMTGSDTTGNIQFTIDYVSYQGMSGVTTTGTTDSSAVTFYLVDPYTISRVKNITQHIGYDTIQEAINSVGTDDIITVESGAYTEDIDLKYGPFTLSGIGEPVLAGKITLKNSSEHITLQGFSPISTLYADLNNRGSSQYSTLRDAIGYVTTGATIFINGGEGGEFAYADYMEDDVVSINKSLSIIGTGTYRPNIYFENINTGGRLLINAQNVTIKNIYFYADYGISEVVIQTQEATGVSFNNCVFDSLVVENLNAAPLIATGNYERNNGVNEPTRYSGNIYYIPRCTDEACTTFQYTGYAQSRVKNITQTKGYDTIQDALSDPTIASGDVITVQSGVYEGDVGINQTVVLSGIDNPVISGQVQFSKEGIIMEGFTVMDIKVSSSSENNLLPAAIAAISPNGTISVGYEAGFYYQEPSTVYINKPMTIVGVDGKAHIQNGNFNITTGGVIIRNLKIDAGSFVVNTPGVVSIADNIFTNPMGIAVENQNAIYVYATGNYRGANSKDPVANGVISGNVYYTPFCNDQNCSMLIYTGYAESRVKNVTQKIGFDTIQGAVMGGSDPAYMGAINGDVITVESGSYEKEGDVGISNSITLSGLGNVYFSGRLYLNRNNITIQGFNLPTVSVGAGGNLQDAVDAVNSGGIVYVDGSSGFDPNNEPGIYINKPLTFIGNTGLNRADLVFTGTGVIIDSPNVTFNYMSFRGNPTSTIIKTNVVNGVRFNNCRFASGIVENAASGWLYATGNYRGAGLEPLVGTNFSGQIKYSPRCIDSGCMVLGTNSPVGTISYSITGWTNQNVTASISFNKGGITVTNNGGSTGYLFTGNGSFTFEFQDGLGETGITTAMVTGIDKTVPTFTNLISGGAYYASATIYYSDANISGAIISGLDNSYFNGNYPTNTTITPLGKFIFTVYDLAGNSTGAIFYIETTPPTVSKGYISSGTTGSDETNMYYKGTINIRADVSDNVGLSGATCMYTTGSTRIAATYNSTYCEVTGLTPNANINIRFKIADLTNQTTIGTTGTYIYDNTPPTATVNYSPATTTSGNVIATISGSELITVTNNIGTSYLFTNTGLFTFEFEDVVGNTGSTTATVVWIDKIAPTAYINYSYTGRTNQNVTARITGFSESITNLNTGSYVFVSNGIFVFTFQDLAGNAGVWTATVNNIDKTAPIITIDPYTTGWTNQNIFVTASTNEGTLNTTGHLFTGNGTFNFVATDLAGNVSTGTVTISKIDKSPVTGTIAYSPSTLTNQNVTATISFNKAGVTITNNSGNTKTFTGNNSTFIFLFQDQAGNTGSNAVNINRIDKVTPTILHYLGDNTYDVYLTGGTADMITFSKPIYNTGQIVSIISRGADHIPSFQWIGNNTGLLITAHASGTTWADDIAGSIIDMAGNTNLVLLIDSTINTGTQVQGSGTIALTGEATQVVMSTDNATINIPENVTDATIKVSVSTEGSNTVATVPEIIMNVDTTAFSSNIVVAITGDTKITGPSTWTGIITPPTIKLVAAVAPTPETNKTNTVEKVIEIGFGEGRLSFDKAVRLLIPGQAGKKVGYISGSSFIEITTTCVQDDQARADTGLATNAECKKDVGTSDLVIWTKHFTQFVTYTQTTTTSNTTNGGGGAAGPQKDICSDRDCSNSYYDGICGVCPAKPATGTIHKAADMLIKTGSILGSKYSKELNNAYLYAYSIGITTMPTIQKADLGGKLTRVHMAKMMVNYAVKVLGLKPDTSKKCDFKDISNQSAELKGYIGLACQLGLMGTNATKFNPSGTVSRAEFGTVLSRAFRGNKYENTKTYYKDHLQALKNAGIITNITSTLKETRGNIMLMLMRAK